MSGAGEKSPEVLAAEAAEVAAQAEAQAQAASAEAARVAAEAAAAAGKTPEELAAAAAAAEAAKTKEPPVTKEDWRERRLAKTAAQRDAERTRREALEVEVAELKAGKTSAMSDEQIEAEVQRRLKAAGPQKSWDDRMNSVVTAGREKFGKEKFGESVNQLRALVDFKDPAEATQYRALLAAAEATGSAAELIFELGKDPSKAQELLETPALQMTVQLANMARDLKKPEELSKMPRPIVPIFSQGIHYEALKPDETTGMKLPMAEWVARREKQARDRGIQ